MLVVFDPDIIITTEVLAILWDEEPDNAEDIMMSRWNGGEESYVSKIDFESLYYIL